MKLFKWGWVGIGRDWLLFNSPVHTFWIKLTIACLGKEKINNYQVSQALSPLQACLFLSKSLTKIWQSSTNTIHPIPNLMKQAVGMPLQL